MTALHMAYTELRRLSRTALGKATLVALVLVPTLYAGLYLYANRDPYANLDQVPAALVMEDVGASDAAGRSLEYGDDVALQLVDQGAFDWEVTDRATAADGVDDGTYDFALVVPRDFSASLANVAPDVDKARIQMITNDANSYLSTTVANQLVVDVREAIAAEVSQKAAATFLLGLADVRATLLESSAGIRRFDSRLGRTAGVAGDVSEDTSELAGDAEKLADRVGEAEDEISGLPGQARPVAAAAERVAASAAAQAKQGDAAATAAREAARGWTTGRGDLADLMEARGISEEDQAAILRVYDRAGAGVPRTRAELVRLNGRLRAREAAARQVSAGTVRLATAARDAQRGLDAAAEAAAELSGGLEDLSESSEKVRTGLERLSGRTSALSESLADGAAQVPSTDEDSRLGIARTLSDPVDVQAASGSTQSHAAGLAPLVLALAAWIGAVVLFWLVRPLSRRALAGNAPSWRTAFGGWLAPAAVALVQAGLLMAATVATIQLTDSRVVPTLAFLLLVSASFVAVTHALVAWLGATGVFLAFVLMFLQAITAGGAFPWETTPAALHPLHHVLPMGYAVDGLRQLMFGGYSDRLLLHVAVLVGWLLGALAVATLVARRQRVWTPTKVAPDLVLR